MPGLGDVLIEMGAATPRTVRAGLENQAVFGGRLGTNLLELNLVTEEVLAAALGRKHRCPSAFGDPQIDPEVLGLLSLERVDKLEVVPARLVGRRLDVFLADPDDLAKVDAVAFATGKLVRPVVVAEARLWALMQKHYGIERQHRGLAFDLSGGAPVLVRERMAEPSAATGDLMGEDEFSALYSRTREPVSRPADAPREPAPAAWRLARSGRELAASRAQARPSASAQTPPTAAPHPTTPPAERAPSQAEPARLGGAFVSFDEMLAALHRDPSQLGSRADGVAMVDPSTPLSFDDAIAALAGVDDRDEIARIVLRFAQSRFRRVILLAVHGDVAEGWDGIGEGLTPDVVARVSVRVRAPGVVNTVVTSRAHFLGPLLRTDENIAFLRSLGRGAPKNSFAMPILAREQVVNVLYADDGRGATVDPAGVGELLILASKIAQIYEQLMAQAS
jgi:hypothetical protein